MGDSDDPIVTEEGGGCAGSEGAGAALWEHAEACVRAHARVQMRPRVVRAHMRGLVWVCVCARARVHA